MKKTTLVLCAAVALTCCACKTTETEKTSIDYSKITVQGVLDKSAEVRDNINNYKAAQQVASQTEAGKDALNNIKDSAKEKYNEIKQKVTDEKNAWQETLKK